MALEGEDTRRYACPPEQPTQKQNATGPEDFKTTSPGSSDGSLLPTATLAKRNESISKETAATRLAPLKAQYTRLSLMVDPNSDTMKLLVVGGYGVFQAYYKAVLLPNESPATIAWIGSFQIFFLVSCARLLRPKLGESELKFDRLETMDHLVVKRCGVLQAC